MPELYARIMADADASFAKGELTFTGVELSRLIGRPTTPVGDTVAAEVVDGIDLS
ncbi:NAD(P)H dehydrogenase (quinone) [Streptomyces mirabilis]|jgi:NAD(P)H dehydrogenase (quinone)|uniref:NAD(P)H dehydrogenase (Quinone) n=1 Tax=Streptomyces mirabilis TaxID=68239 RepID=A0A1I2REZ7_9ACTN|nr:NAD(P)H dehydrogenase (quinone) [Streptomyces mirabilis]